MDTEEGENITGLGILPREWGFEQILGTLTRWSNSEKMNLLSWFENQRDLPDGYKKPRLCSWRACVHEQSKGSRLKTPQGSSQFPVTTPVVCIPACSISLLQPLLFQYSSPLGKRLLLQEESAHIEQSQLWPNPASKQGEGKQKLKDLINTKPIWQEV